MKPRLLQAIALTAGLASVIGVQGLAASEVESTRGNADRGKVVYTRHCAGCHGAKGKGDGYRMLGNQPADLTSRSTKHKSEAELLTTIHEGKPNMPVWKNLLSEQQIVDVLAYVRTLAR